MTAIKFFAVLVAVFAVAHASTGPFSGVDPNTLSCDPEGHVFLLLPHYEECNKYFMCVHGQEVEFMCPSVLIFDYEHQTCNWDWSTKCWLRSSSGDIDDIEGSGSGDGRDFFIENEEEEPVDILDDVLKPSNSGAALTNLDVILKCNSVKTASQQMAYRGDCQRYWRCESGVPQAVYCADGLYYNPAKQQCDYEANVICHVPQEDELNGEFIKV